MEGEESKLKAPYFQTTTLTTTFHPILGGVKERGPSK